MRTLAYPRRYFAGDKIWVSYLFTELASASKAKKLLFYFCQMKSPKCIIFDCDGVLVNSEPIAISTLVNMANELGIDIDYDYGVRHFQGNAMSSVIKIIQSHTDQPLPPTFEQSYRTTSFQRFTKELKAIEGIPKLLQQLTIPYGVASSGPVKKIRHNLNIIGLLSQFEGRIYSCYDLQKWKPDPAIYLHAATTMGFSPKDCLVVEDSLMGVQAGVAAGCQVLAYATHAQNPKELEEAGATLFYDMMELLGGR